VSLPPVIYRDIGEGVQASERLIYRVFIDRLMAERDHPIPITMSILRTAEACGVSRRRVLAIVRQHNQEVFHEHP
jgi:hypothetical protein